MKDAVEEGFDAISLDLRDVPIDLPTKAANVRLLMRDDVPVVLSKQSINKGALVPLNCSEDSVSFTICRQRDLNRFTLPNVSREVEIPLTMSLVVIVLHARSLMNRLKKERNQRFIPSHKVRGAG
jgi:hypothetical protein